MERSRAMIQAVVLDIEGTITSIDFVKKTLFPFARDNAREFLVRNWERTDVKQLVAEFRRLSESPSAAPIPLQSVPSSSDQCAAVAALDANIAALISADSKASPLKQLQGLIWRDAYEDGRIKGHLYSDVVAALRELHLQGIRLYIYSSGSVQAQKLLLGHSVEGDVTELLSGYFDTNVGQKVEPESYRRIAEQIGLPIANILFVTDLELEARAAYEAGMDVVVTVRPGNAKLSEECARRYGLITSIEELLPRVYAF